MGKHQLLQIFKCNLKWTAIVCLLGWKKYLINLHHNFPEFASPHGTVVRHTLAQRENHTLNYIKKFRFGASKCNLLWFTKVKTRSSCPKCCARQCARRAVIHFEQGKRKKIIILFFLFFSLTLWSTFRPAVQHHLGIKTSLLYSYHVILSNMMIVL